MMSLTDEPVLLTSAEIDRTVTYSTRAPVVAAANGHEVGSVPQPAEGLRLAPAVLARLAAGQIVTLIPEHAELTLDQAADLLAVSPPFVASPDYSSADVDVWPSRF